MWHNTIKSKQMFVNKIQFWKLKIFISFRIIFWSVCELYQDDDETKDFSINFENINLQIIVWTFVILYTIDLHLKISIGIYIKQTKQNSVNNCILCLLIRFVIYLMSEKAIRLMKNIFILQM